MSSEDLSIVTNMLAGILNPNNAIRKEAESKLQLMQENMGGLLFCLGKVLKGKIRNLNKKQKSTTSKSNPLLLFF